MTDTKFNELLLFKGKAKDGKPLFDTIPVFDLYSGETPVKGGIGLEMAIQYLKRHPFEYPRFLEGKPCGKYAVAETLAQFGLKPEAEPAKKAKRGRPAKAKDATQQAEPIGNIDSDFNK